MESRAPPKPTATASTRADDSEGDVTQAGDTTTLVLGLGNTLLGDEGAGVRAIDRLQSQQPDLQGVEYLDGGTLSFTLAGPIEEADQLIVIDVAQLNQPPGVVEVFEGDEMDRFVGEGKKTTAHEVSLLDLLAIAHLSESLPPKRALIAIQPQCIDWGETLSDAVEQALPRVCDRSLELIHRWRR
jgi:hydrogenase maturation protease